MQCEINLEICSGNEMRTDGRTTGWTDGGRPWRLRWVGDKMNNDEHQSMQFAHCPSCLIHGSIKHDMELSGTKNGDCKNK